MRNEIVRALAAACALCLAACADLPKYRDELQATLGPNHGMIVVFLKHGSGLDGIIRVDGEAICALGDYQSCYIRTSPGRHTVSSQLPGSGAKKPQTIALTVNVASNSAAVVKIDSSGGVAPIPLPFVTVIAGGATIRMSESTVEEFLETRSSLSPGRIVNR